MQLSQTAEYALRAIVWLAQHAGDAQTNQQIAAGCKMPAGYLAKVLQPLARAELITSQRGLGGGYVLARSPDSLSLIEVINAVEPVQRIRSCPLKLSSHAGRLCALHQTLDDAMAEVERALTDRTIGQLLAMTTGVKPLCNPTAQAVVPLSISAGKLTGSGRRPATGAKDASQGSGHAKPS